MARGGMARGPAGGAGRPQPPRRPTPQRGAKPGQKAQPKPGKAGASVTKADQQRRVQEQQQRQQRQARAGQQRLRQQHHLQAHIDKRRKEAQRRSEEIREQVARLESILTRGLDRSAVIDLDGLQRPVPGPEFDPGPLANPLPEPDREALTPPAAAGGLTGVDRIPGGKVLAGLFGGGQGQRERREAESARAYEQAREQWEQAEQERLRRLAEAERDHAESIARRQAEVAAYNERITRVAAGLRARDPKVVESFLRTVLRRVPLPASFPRGYAVRHDPAAELATVEMALPGRAVIPTEAGYEYRPQGDELRPVPRPEAQIDDLHRRVVAQCALLVVRDVFEAEPAVRTVALDGRVDGGEQLRFTVDRQSFLDRDLRQGSPVDHLAQFGADLAGVR